MNELVTVSFRCECPHDAKVIVKHLMSNMDFNSPVTFKVILDKGNLPLLEPIFEVTLTEHNLQVLVHKLRAEDHLYVALDTMRRLPANAHNFARQYGEGEFYRL